MVSVWQDLAAVLGTSLGLHVRHVDVQTAVQAMANVELIVLASVRRVGITCRRVTVQLDLTSTAQVVYMDVVTQLLGSVFVMMVTKARIVTV